MGVFQDITLVSLKKARIPIVCWTVVVIEGARGEALSPEVLVATAGAMCHGTAVSQPEKTRTIIVKD